MNCRQVGCEEGEEVESFAYIKWWLEEAEDDEDENEGQSRPLVCSESLEGEKKIECEAE